MPSGKVHDKITLITTPIVFVLSNTIINNIGFSIFLTLCYVFSSLMFNGDLDIVSKPYNRWFVLKIIWKPYQKIFKHRSIFTHGILIGTIVRIIYLGFIIIPTLYFTNNIDLLNRVPIEYYMFGFIGLELGNIIHTTSDRLF